MPQITIRELAELCGVAVSTVSRDMTDRSEVSPRTRERVLAAAAEHGYVPNVSARSLKITSTKLIAAVIQGETSPLLLELFGLLGTQLAERGYGLTLTQVADDSAHADTVARVVNERKHAGVVFLGRYGDQDHGEGPDLGRSLAQIGVPMVFCTTADFSGVSQMHSSVSVDDRAGGYQLTRHLLDLGHRRIAFASEGEAVDSQHVWALRLAGYRQALAGAYGSPERGLVLPAALPAANYSMANGHESVRRQLAAHGLTFTALVCSCDAVAVGATRALIEAGYQVPGDCSVTGFDDLDIARYTTPSLTTVAQPLADIAATTARVLLLAVEQPGAAPEQICIRGHLIERESSGPRRRPQRRCHTSPAENGWTPSAVRTSSRPSGSTPTASPSTDSASLMTTRTARPTVSQQAP